MQQQRAGGSRSYNEIVLDSASWIEHMPRTIEAVFYNAGGTDWHPAAKTLHGKLLAAYGLTAEQVPLLRYDPKRDLSTPFSVTA